MTYDISVIIPTYNAELFVEEALLSIKNQTFSGSVEMIIIDDCSTDNTCKIIEAFMANHQHLSIRLLKQKENMRQGAARNRGLLVANGNFVFFLDADDYIEESALEKLWNYAVTHDCEVVVCNWLYQKEGQLEMPKKPKFMNKSFLCKEACERLLEASTYFTVDKLYKKSFLTKHNILYGEKYIYEDYEFYVDVAQRAEKVGILQDALYVVRLNEFSTTKTNRNTSVHIDSLVKAVAKTVDIFQPRKKESYYFLYKYLIKKTMSYLHHRAPVGQKRKTLNIILNLLSEKGTDYYVPRNIKHPLFILYFRKRLVQNKRISAIILVDWFHRKKYLLPLFENYKRCKNILTFKK